MNIENDKKENFDELMQQLQKMELNICNLQQEFTEKIKNDNNQKDAFEKLYIEMKLYKDNFLQTATKPLIQDLILLYDNTKRQHKMAENKMAKQCILNTLEEVEEILYRRDVELIFCDEEKLQRKLQRVVKIIPNSNKEEHNKILEIIRDGFTWNNTVLRPQEVVVYKYCDKC